MNNKAIVAKAYNEIATIAEFAFSESDSESDETKYVSLFLSRIMGKNMIDLGCGRGRLENYIHRIKGIDIIGYDISEGMLKIANEGNQYPEHISYYLTDIHTINPKTTFDAAMLSFSLIHLTNEQANGVLRNLYRYLNDGAVVYISVLAGDKELGFINEPLNDEITTYVNLFTKANLKKMLIQNGFKITNFNMGIDSDPAAFSRDTMFILAQKI